MAEQKPVRVMIVDDHPLVRRTLVLLVQSHNELEYAGEAASGVDAIRLCSECHPDVILMDIMMPDMDGVEATRLILQDYPHIQIIGLTSYSDDVATQTILDAGAVTCILKTTSTDELVRTICDIGRGSTSD